jgi:hypothetical protein
MPTVNPTKPTSPAQAAPGGVSDGAVSVAPREPIAVALQPGPGRFKVWLKDNPALVVAAGDRMAAVDEYKRRCGIISTVHEFTVTPTDEPESK